MNDNNEYIYIAAGLFNIETNMFNAYLTDKLENRFGYNCYLPQREGFETSKMAAFYEKIPGAILDGDSSDSDSDLLEKAIPLFPYYLDLGYYMARSIAVVANLDEPIDIGMVIEIAYAKICNIPVIGLRADLRTPLGDRGNIIGINPFPVEQCDCYINVYPPTGDIEEITKLTDSIIEKIDEKLKEWIPRGKNMMRESDHHVFHRLVNGAEKLFSGIIDKIHHPEHTEEVMDEVLRRFSENKDYLMAISPELVQLNVEAD